MNSPPPPQPEISSLRQGSRFSIKQGVFTVSKKEAQLPHAWSDVYKSSFLHYFGDLCIFLDPCGNKIGRWFHTQKLYEY